LNTCIIYLFVLHSFLYTDGAFLLAAAFLRMHSLESRFATAV
jgi:hypothetical protein